MSSALRVLIIDDDPVMRELLGALLEYAGHRPEMYETGEAALTRFNGTGAAEFDVVLMDLHMPGLQGSELASALCMQRTSGTVLVGMSGSFPTEQEKQMLDVFLQKPFTTAQFEQAVAAARQNHGAMGERIAAAEPASPAGTASGQSQCESAEPLDLTILERLQSVLPAGSLRSLYDMTMDDVASRVERMRQMQCTGDLAGLRSEAHAIKGGAGMVGALEIYRIAEALEEGASPDSAALDDFAPASERLRRMLDERFPLQT